MTKSTWFIDFDETGNCATRDVLGVDCEVFWYSLQLLFEYGTIHSRWTKEVCNVASVLELDPRQNDFLHNYRFCCGEDCEGDWQMCLSLEMVRV